jgi:hypothetical protein
LELIDDELDGATAERGTGAREIGFGRSIKGGRQERRHVGHARTAINVEAEPSALRRATRAERIRHSGPILVGCGDQPGQHFLVGQKRRRADCR